MGMVSLVSPWSWCSCVHCQTLVCGYGLWAWFRLSLRGPGARVFSAERWYADTAYGQGLVDMLVVVQRQVAG